jgi:hypothetical protein
VNYDLFWNPNRLEQRFGRIHRIGQTEVCHLWNLVADETREGDVYARLLRKIERQRLTLGDSVFDVMGKLFRERSLRSLLLEAVRYGERPEVRARLEQAVDNLSDQERVRQLIEESALVRDSLDISKVHKIRQDFERAQARRLQPHFVASFFKAAFEQLGGRMYARESMRHEITHVPASLRNQSRLLGRGMVLTRYERITFYKEAINLPGKPTAEFICPGHPLMDALLDLTLQRYRHLLREGAFLLDANDPSEEIRALFYLEQTIFDNLTNNRETRIAVSRQMQFVEVSAHGETRHAGPAPFLDYKPLSDKDRALVAETINQKSWLKSDLEAQVQAYAVEHIVPNHLDEVKGRREEMVDRTLAAVKDRLTKEISYWDHRAQDLKAQEASGRKNARLNSSLARNRADNLQARLEGRLQDLARMRKISAQAPIVIGGALIIPAGLLHKLHGETVKEQATLFGSERKAVEKTAMQAVIDNERALGYRPKDVSQENLGWDIESEIPGSGKLRFIEVKGRMEGARTVTISKNEILAGLNKPDDYYLAVVEVNFENEQPQASELHYIKMPYQKEPDFAATSVNYEWEKFK